MELLEKLDSDFINAFKSKQIDKKNFLLKNKSTI